jgi:hypothetical protein
MTVTQINSLSPATDAFAPSQTHPGEGPMIDLVQHRGCVHAASLLAFKSAKVSPVSAITAFAPVNCCQRSMATST